MEELALFLCYGIYNSPRGAPFVRLGKPRNPHVARDYMEVTVTAPKHPGSTGVVHPRILRIAPDSAPIDIVVKLGFSDEDKETLEHEYRMYSRLRNNGVTGIPHAIGLFSNLDTYEAEDTQEGPYALVLTHAGTTLWEWYKDKSLGKLTKKTK